MLTIEILSHPDLSRGWEHELLRRLAAAGYRVAVRHAATPAPRAPLLDAVLGFERHRFGPSLASPSPPLPPSESPPPALIIDMTGTATGQGVPVLTLAFAGHDSFPAGLAQMLAGDTPPELITRLDGVPVGRARPMLSDRVWLSRAGDAVLAGAVSLLVQGVDRFAPGRLHPLAVPPSAAVAGASFARTYPPALIGGLATRLVQKLRRDRRPFYWQVAYRQFDGPGIAETGALDGPAFTVLADDGARFYADPFVIARTGGQYLFVEEFPYATGKGVIAVARLGADGRFGVPQVVLEERHHLSYPQIFARDGEIFMLPESSGARELVLYRAESFPDRWVRDTVLLADRDFNDATLLEAEGRFWLFGTERFGAGSSSDTMTVYSAPALRGPWTPHPRNPIAIDASAARPGGAFIRRAGKLLLPVQDGARAYGGGLGLMELLRLDADEISFAPPRPVAPGPAWARAGIHTLNRAGRLEVVDSAG